MNDQDKFFKVGIYLRLSNEDRDKNLNEDSESIKNQRNLLIEYINKQPQFILIDEYCDEDLSGAGMFRPEFSRLINDCESGKLDVVLCKSQSRFSRDMQVVEKYINNKFKEWNVRFIGLSDNADTDNYGNKKSRQINGLVNEWYLEDVSNNIRSAFTSKMKQGEFISPFASYGYEISKSDNNKLVVDKTAAQTVKKIFYLYIKGFGYSKIAQYLNNKKIPSPSLYKYQNGCKLNIISNKPRDKIKWSSNAVKKILTNELYLGHLIQGKRTTVSYKNHKIINKDKSMWIKKENTHDAIIDKSTFNKVQNLVKKRTRVIKKSGCIHLFSGKVFCNECQSIMRKKNSTKHAYLTCTNKSCLNKSSIRYDILEKKVQDQINIFINKYIDILVLENKYYKQRQTNVNNFIIYLEKQKSDIQKKITKTQNYIKSLYEDKINGEIKKNQFKNLLDMYTLDFNNLKKKLKDTKEKINTYKTNSFSKKNVKEIIKKYLQIQSLNKIIVDEFVDEIFISKINQKTNFRDIKIKWNFK